MGAEPYIVTTDGTTAVDAVMWDGVSPYQHPSGGDLVRAVEWAGAPFTAPYTPEEVDRRTRVQRARDLRSQLRDDLAMVDAATIAQLRPIIRRVIRAERLLLAFATDDQDDDG